MSGQILPIRESHLTSLTVEISDWCGTTDILHVLQERSLGSIKAFTDGALKGFHGFALIMGQQVKVQGITIREQTATESALKLVAL